MVSAVGQAADGQHDIPYEDVALPCGAGGRRTTRPKGIAISAGSSSATRAVRPDVATGAERSERPACRSGSCNRSPCPAKATSSPSRPACSPGLPAPARRAAARSPAARRAVAQVARRLPAQAISGGYVDLRCRRSLVDSVGAVVLQRRSRRYSGHRVAAGAAALLPAAPLPRPLRVGRRSSTSTPTTC